MIIQISFREIYPVWRKHLWPDRTSMIESTSAMSFLGGFDLKNMSSAPSFLAYIDKNDNILGVNSGHRCMDNSYRSRGLYVFPEYRNQGIGKILLLETIEIAKREECGYVWSFPRHSSWSVYSSAGFMLSTDWFESENGINAYCRYDLD